MSYQYDLVVVGGGPAGASCALYAGRGGLKTLLVDRAVFPRDKACGDVIPRKGIEALRELGLLENLDEVPHVRAGGMIFSAPGGAQVEIPFEDAGYACYVCRRLFFDELLFRAAGREVEAWEGFQVEDLLLEEGRVCGVVGMDRAGHRSQVRAKVVVGADGYGSVVSQRMGLRARDPEHVAVAVRAYWRGVEGVEDAIEIHFTREVLPGYFWIFPVGEGLVNVGLGMLHRELKKRRISLRQAYFSAIESPFFRRRFEKAEQASRLSGWGLPLGSKRRTTHGDGFVLVGDAAGLVNPFSGEGIGNAVWSGRIAAESLAEVCRGDDYGSAALQIYSERLWAAIGPVLRLNHSLQRVGRIHSLLDLVISRAAARSEVRDWIALMMAGAVSKRSLLSPLTYLRLLFS